MSRKKSDKAREGGYGRLFAGTIALALVFSAGLITGQRLLHRKALPPMVSLSTTAVAAEAPTVEEQKPLKTTFSFYEHLTAEKAAPAEDAVAPEANVEPATSEPTALPAEAKQTEEPAVDAKPVAEELVEAPKAAPAPPEPPKDAKVLPTGSTVADAAEALQEAVETFTKPAAAPEALPARYTLQVSSHPTRESAEKEMDRLRQAGVEPHILNVDVPGKGTLYRIRVGKFHSMDEARHFQASLKEKRGVPGFVTPL